MLNIYVIYLSVRIKKEKETAVSDCARPRVGVVSELGRTRFWMINDVCGLLGL